MDMSISLNGSPSGLRVSPQVQLYNALIEVGLKMNSQALWSDATFTSLTAWGSWKSASAPFIKCPYEVILIGYKETWKKERPKDTPGINTISKEDFILGVGGIWNIKPETRGLTKANFPVELPKLCIELLSFQDDVVLDPFMGSGTTAVACVRTKRNYVGFEISPNYHKIAEDRVAKETLFY
jgi:site-specific DNA-methyltransferase (adenine-specific)